MAENIADNFWNLALDDVAPLLRQHQSDVYAFRFLYGAYHYDPDNDCEPMPGEFNAWPDYRQFGGPNLALMLGSSHALEIPFFFGNFEWFGSGEYIFKPENYPGYEFLSDAMMAYVAQFAYTGDPGDTGGVQWLPWNDTSSGPRILFDADEDETLLEMTPLNRKIDVKNTPS